MLAKLVQILNATSVAYNEAHLNNFPAPALMIGFGWMLNKIGMQSLNMFLKISLS